MILIILGAFIYVYDRSSGNIFLLIKYFSANNEGKSMLGDLGFYLPTFLHIIGFSMITKSFFYASKKSNYVIPLFWGSLNILIEFGQLYNSESSLKYLSNDHHSYTIKKVMYNYFATGVFDWFDILFAVIGIIFSFLLFKFLKTEEDPK